MVVCGGISGDEEDCGVSGGDSGSVGVNGGSGVRDQVISPVGAEALLLITAEEEIMIVDDHQHHNRMLQRRCHHQDSSNHQHQKDKSSFFSSTPMATALKTSVLSSSNSPIRPSLHKLPAHSSISTSSSTLGGGGNIHSTIDGTPPVNLNVDPGMGVAKHPLMDGGDLDEGDPLHRYYTPLPVDLDLHGAIVEVIALEPKYQPTLTLSMCTKNMLEITGRMRNGSCHVLRALKVWYELPSDTFFLAVSTMDRFLTRMRAQPKHLSCIAVSAFHVACEELSDSTGVPAPSRDSISVISQSKCTPGDVQRMEEIIRTKLELGMHVPDSAVGLARYHKVPGHASLPVTALTVLKLVHAGHRQLLLQHFPHHQPPPVIPPLLPMLHKLEVVVCDTRAANFRPSELALALLGLQLRSVDHLNYGGVHSACLQPLMTLCKMNPSILSSCSEVVACVLLEYDAPPPGRGGGSSAGGGAAALYHRQRLVWKLSNRTLRQLRPTDKLKRYPRMPTISETCRDNTTYCSPVWRRYGTTVCKTRREPNASGGATYKNQLEKYRLGGFCNRGGDVKSEEVEEVVVGVKEAEEKEEEEEGSEAKRMNSDGRSAVEGSDVGKLEKEERMDTVEEGEHQMETGDGEQEKGEVNDEERMEEGSVVDEVKEAQKVKSNISKIVAEATIQESPRNEQEESYSQVAKKKREDKSPSNTTTDIKKSPFNPNINRSSSHRPILQYSPFSKITLTPALSSSSAVKNLSAALLDDEPSDVGYYGYHYRRLVGIVGIEGIDGEVIDGELEIGAGDGRLASTGTSNKNAKRKKPRVKLQLVAHPRGVYSDAELSSDLASSSSEEEMDSDYEKEFPPLPLPRPPHHRGAAVRKKTTAAASAAPIKKKKKSEASPYANKSKPMRKMHSRKIAVQK